MNRIDQDHIINAIQEHFRFHTGDCELTEADFTEYYVQVALLIDLLESFEFEGFRSLTLLQIVTNACQKQVIADSK